MWSERVADDRISCGEFSRRPTEGPISEAPLTSCSTQHGSEVVALLREAVQRLSSEGVPKDIAIINEIGLKIPELAPVAFMADVHGVQSRDRRGSPSPDRTTVLRRNNVRVLGHGSQTIIFAHGFGCDQEMWRSVAPAFLSDFTVVLFDHIGAGAANSSAFDRIRHSSLQGYTQDVLDILGVLQLQHVHFVGHSVSGMIGALASIADPELFASLTMISASPRYINDGEYVGGFERYDIEGLLEVLSSNYLGWSMTMAPVFMKNEQSPELAKELELSFCKVDPVIAHHFAQVIFLSDFRLELPKIVTRTLVLQPREDVVVPVQVGEYVQRSIPHSRLVVLDAKGHYPHLSAPDEVIREIKRFLTVTPVDTSR